MGPDGQGLQPLVPRPGGSARTARLARLRDDPRAGMALLVAVALVAGWFWYRAGVDGGAVADLSATAAAPSTTAAAADVPGGVTVPAGAAVGAPATVATAEPGLVVHVAGGVVRPGVYHLPAGARVDDAITAAGGAVPGVDVDAVNRAAPVSDGQRVRVPLPGEPAPPPEPAPAPTSASSTGMPTPAAPVNLNTATVEQLETLPGVGPAIAAAIVDQRTRSGGFRTVRDLLDVRGIGESRLAQLEPLVTV
jgi:competence protein ComEA